MSDSFSALNEDEQVLVRFLAEREERGDQATQDYLQRYPHLKTRILALLQAQSAIDHSNPEPVLSVPERLGDFHLRRPIGRGGMGQIYEAIQQPFGRRVAVKTIRRGRITAEARERFLREQDVLARLHQTHIVPIHAAGEHDSLQYFAMPYIEGAALDDLLASLLGRWTANSDSKTPTLATLASDLSSRSSYPKDTPGVPTLSEETVARSSASAPPPLDRSQHPQKLSADYFRSVAQTMRDAAQALQHAHDVHILHRDVKPANIMVDRAGQCWIIDFGLACFLNGAEPDHRTAKDAGQKSALAQTASVAGTLAYMAPEQFRCEVDARRDVWGLGATLYELLTLQRAFPGGTDEEIRKQIEHGEPTPPHELIRNVPRDLSAICLKALRKEPAERYQTARGFADDLRRWLGHEPTTARPARTMRRVSLWARRNRGWAAAIGLGLLFLACAIGWLYAAMMMAEQHERLSQTALMMTEERERISQRELLLLQLQRLRLTTHQNGWSQDAIELVRRIAKIPKDDDLRDQAAATFVGLDAALVKTMHDYAPSSLTWDPSGKRILFGGASDPRGQPVLEAKLWDEATDTGHLSGRGGRGPVAFRPDGTPVQVVAADSHTLELWDVSRQRLIRRLTLPTAGKPAPLTGLNQPVMGISPNGALVAGSANGLQEKGPLAVWEAASGKLLQRFKSTPTALSFNAGAELLAAGDEKGTVTVWSMPGEVEVARLPVGRNAISCLALQRDYVRRPGAKRPWLLAAGDAGGSVTVWDLDTGDVRTRCPSSGFDIDAVALSPDGATLASVSRKPVRLWDVATGRLLLEMFNTRHIRSDLAFSPDGRRLAVCSEFGMSDVNNVDIWELETGRGLQSLRGLSGHVHKVAFSHDGELLAALATDWQVGVWDMATGRLLHVFDAPQGITADNAALAFNRDGKQLAIATAGGARLWKVASGEEVRKWDLPQSLCDALAFPSDDRLLLIRFETKQGTVGPWSAAPPEDYPRVCRVRDLLAPDFKKILQEIAFFNHHGLNVLVAADGDHFVVDGVHGIGVTPSMPSRDMRREPAMSSGHGTPRSTSTGPLRWISTLRENSVISSSRMANASLWTLGPGICCAWTTRVA
jgi:serine/threonine protein kinase/WD40 repeat protein